ncbi:MAG: ferric reductase-like transmembrane domain-containing protein [Candidatus Dormibacteraeota bacterium]|nr:ferric reductase-like transmembrane domain-containing protein [Candidatus Dormibacteraeota bacterium]
MKTRLATLFWLTAYTFLALAPLVIALFGVDRPARAFLIEFSVALGFVGLSMMGLQFALVARFKTVAAPFGIDFLNKFHREVSFVALAFILAHPILLFVQDSAKYLPLLNVVTAPWRARFGVSSVLLLIVLIGTSIWRRQLRLSYEVWQLTHGILAVAIVLFALLHIHLVGFYTQGVARRLLFDLYGASLIMLLVWVRVIAPALRLRRPWRVVRVQPQRGASSTVVFEPVGHEGFDFQPGQFVWLSARRSPFNLTYHPISFSSEGDVEPGGEIAITVKERGDWTREIPTIKPGARLFVDGPHGVFSMDLEQAMGYGFIAGGVGITPMYSMVSTMLKRGDVRPVYLFYANGDWEHVTFREELAELAKAMPNLHVIHVLGRPPDGWDGESGRITAELLQRHLPAHQYRRYQYFICGPGPMMDAMEAALSEIGVPHANIDTERFDMV